MQADIIIQGSWSHQKLNRAFYHGNMLIVFKAIHSYFFYIWLSAKNPLRILQFQVISRKTEKPQ